MTLQPTTAIRDNDAPTADELNTDMVRRLRNSLQDEVHHLTRVINANSIPNAQLINRNRVAAYTTRRDNIQRILDQLNAGSITITVA